MDLLNKLREKNKDIQLMTVETLRYELLKARIHIENLELALATRPTPDVLVMQVKAPRTCDGGARGECISTEEASRRLLNQRDSIMSLTTKLEVANMKIDILLKAENKP